MAIVFNNAKVFLGGFDLSGDLNQIGLEYGAEALDATVFSNTSRVMKGGLKFARVNGRGFVQEGTNLVGQTLFEQVAVDDVVVMLFPDGITEGATSTGSGYMFKATESRYNPGGQVGEMFAFDFAAEGRGVQP